VRLRGLLRPQRTRPRCPGAGLSVPSDSWGGKGGLRLSPLFFFSRGAGTGWRVCLFSHQISTSSPNWGLAPPKREAWGCRPPRRGSRWGSLTGLGSIPPFFFFVVVISTRLSAGRCVAGWGNASSFSRGAGRARQSLPSFVAVAFASRAFSESEVMKCYSNWANISQRRKSC